MATKRPTVIDTRVIYCGDNLDQLRKLPDSCVDLAYVDPSFNSNRNYEVFRRETKENAASKIGTSERRHTSTTCARATSSCIAYSRKPAAKIIGYTIDQAEAILASVSA
jgi:DNA modification methylase